MIDMAALGRTAGVLLLAQSIGATGASASTLRAILVATSAMTGSGASDISQGSKAGLFSMDQMLKSIALLTGREYDSTLVRDSDFDVRHVNDAISDLPVDADDVVVFWYGGHGFHDPKNSDRFPSMFIPSEFAGGVPAGVQQVDISRRLLAKSPRLLITVFDSCNTTASGYVNNPPYATAPSMPQTPQAISALQHLFDARGELLLAGASVGTEGWVTQNGGFFTLQLQHSLISSVTHGRNEWSDLLSAVTKFIDDGAGHSQQPISDRQLQ